ncbi:hypothetical protein N0V88_004255 [Collariella sp. IMI 366227]|nr:hypothetical protein N0V88_004255 [Collariella sp. IMI 366227]
MSAGNLRWLVEGMKKTKEMGWVIECFEGHDFSNFSCIAEHNTWCSATEGHLTSDSQWCRDKCKCAGRLEKKKRSDAGGGDSNTDIYDIDFIDELIAEQISKDAARPSTLVTVTMTKTATEGAEPTGNA